MLHFFGQNSITILLQRFGLSTGQYLSSQYKWSHFSCSIFLSKISVHIELQWFGLFTGPYLLLKQGVTLFMMYYFEQKFYSYRGVVVWSVISTILLPNLRDTFHVALFWAKFLFKHVWVGLVCLLDHTSSQNKGSHVSCHTILSRISIHIEFSHEWWFVPWFLITTKGVTLFMLHFLEQNFYSYRVMVAWSGNSTIPLP